VVRTLQKRAVFPFLQATVALSLLLWASGFEVTQLHSRGVDQVSYFENDSFGVRRRKNTTKRFEKNKHDKTFPHLARQKTENRGNEFFVGKTARWVRSRHEALRSARQRSWPISPRRYVQRKTHNAPDAFLTFLSPIKHDHLPRQARDKHYMI
jgi:hypothetical protein